MNGVENKYRKRRSAKLKVKSLKKANKIDKPLRAWSKIHVTLSARWMQKDVLIQILQKLKRFWHILERPIFNRFYRHYGFFEHIFVNKLDMEEFLERENLNSYTTIKEIKIIIKILPTKKTLGSGGFYGEFYQKHWRKKKFQSCTNF